MQIKNKSILFVLFTIATSVIFWGCYTQLSRPGANQYSDQDEGYYAEDETEEDSGIGVDYQTEEADTHVVVHHVYEHVYDYDFFWDANWRYYYRPWRPNYAWYPYWRAPYYDPWFWDYPYAYIDVFYWSSQPFYGSWAYNAGFWDGYYYGDYSGPGINYGPSQRRSFDRRHQPEGAGNIKPTRANPRLTAENSVVTGIPRRGNPTRATTAIGRDRVKEQPHAKVPTLTRRGSDSQTNTANTRRIKNTDNSRTEAQKPTIDRRRTNRNTQANPNVRTEEKRSSSQGSTTTTRSRSVSRKNSDSNSQRSGVSRSSGSSSGRSQSSSGSSISRSGSSGSQSSGSSRSSQSGSSSSSSRSSGSSNTPTKSKND